MTVPAFKCPDCDLLATSMGRCPYDNAALASFEPPPPGTDDPWVGRFIPEGEERYFIIRRLGSGTFGNVYFAWHRELDRAVAIKISRTDPKDSGWSYAICSVLRQDGCNIALIPEHPNVVRVHDSGPLGENRYLVLEYLRGQDLEALGRTGVSPQSATALIMQACRGLHAVHSVNLVHRDVKLGNLFLHSPPPAGQPGVGAPIVKIIDFGVTRRAGEAQRQPAGTVSYMAPEQFFHETMLDPSADVYSLGVSLYRLVTGRFPFACAEPESLTAQLAALACQEPRRPREAQPGIAISDALEEVIMTAISRVRERRFGSMARFESALAGTPEAEDAERPASGGYCDIDHALSARLPCVPDKPAIKLMYCSQDNHVEWLVPGSPSIKLRAGKDRMVRTDHPFRICVEQKTYQSYYVAPNVQRSMGVCHKSGEPFYPLNAVGWAAGKDGHLYLDMGAHGRLRAGARYKDSLMTLATANAQEGVIICLV